MSKTPRDARGKLLPGGVSLNPRGRGVAFRGMVQHIREQTSDGAELVEFALKVFRGVDPTTGAKIYKHSEQWDAHNWLTERGFGKAITPIDIQTQSTDQIIDVFDPTRLGDEDLATLEALLESATAAKVEQENG